ncbi:MAG TPA: hypothetical protein VFY29_04150 [Terriglobia bacterium]|nr:hypothetical protein [Terriglobia bacterium]
MKRAVLLSSLLSLVLLGTEPSIYAQRGRGGGPGGGGPGGGGIGRGVGIPPVSPARNGNAGANRNDAPGRPAAKPDEAKDVSKDSRERRGSNKVGDEIHLNPKLEAKVNDLLPADTTLADASAGFKNQGQFIAALHVSKNLNIPFADLKAKMTGDDAMSLGDAIQNLRPDLGKAKANDEAKRAEKEAKDTEKAGKA